MFIHIGNLLFLHIQSDNCVLIYTRVRLICPLVIVRMCDFCTALMDGSVRVLNVISVCLRTPCQKSFGHPMPPEACVVGLLRWLGGCQEQAGNDIIVPLSSELLIHALPTALHAPALNAETCSWCQYGWKWRIWVQKSPVPRLSDRHEDVCEFLKHEDDNHWFLHIFGSFKHTADLLYVSLL